MKRFVIRQETKEGLQMKTLEEAFRGCKTKRGILWSFDGVNKEATQQNKPFDWTKHLSGEEVQGLSPVDLETGEVDWLGLDVDLKKKAEEICKKIFEKIGTELLCYRTMGGKWRIIEHLTEPMGVEEAQHRAKDLEKRVEAIGFKCDTGHTLPQGFNLEEGKPGNWAFMPYHPNTPGGKTCDTHCYGPGGLRLTKSQTEFRIKYKDHPIVVASIGMLGKGKNGSRRKAIFCTLLYKKHFDCDVSIEELNKNFGNSLDPDQLQKDIRHCEQSIEKNKYNKEYYLKGEPGWIQKICGVKPHLHDKGFDVIVDTVSYNNVYVRSRVEFFEIEGNSCEFISKEQLNDWWLIQTPKNTTMTKVLLKDPRFQKVKNYLTHAGKTPGIIEISRGEIKGLEPGTYLNIYKLSGVIAKQGDVSKINEYYSLILGKDNWHTIKQKLSFMLKEGGEKVMWFTIIHSPFQGVGKGLLGLIIQSLFGSRNVKINVKFKQLTGSHSTLIDGAQIIILNEVSFNSQSNTGERKEFSEEFKNLITEPNLIINPKHKKEIEVPNLCNFFVFSNSDKPLFITDDDRRAFVINIKQRKEWILKKLEEEGYKEEILKVIEDPSAFKWHLENEIEYDRKMFFKAPPMNEEKEEMIRANLSEFEKLMRTAREERSFPFGHTTLRDGSQEGFHYFYKGIFHTDSLLAVLKMSQKFKKEYIKQDDVINYLKRNCTPWSNKELTRIARLTNGQRLRVYCLEPDWKVKDKLIMEMTEGELGKLCELEPGKDDINKCVKEMPNYQEPELGEYSSHCWACTTKDFETGEKEKTPVNSNECEKCPKCTWGYKCLQCGACGCEKPKETENY